MNVTDFYKYIEHPEQLNASTVAELQEVLEAYPYFQTAHFLYLKSLYNQNNFKFNDQLKFSSVHLNNRKKLLFFLKDKTTFSLEKNISEQVKPVEKTQLKVLKVIDVKSDIEDKKRKSIVNLPSKKEAIKEEPKQEVSEKKLEVSEKKEKKVETVVEKQKENSLEKLDKEPKIKESIVVEKKSIIKESISTKVQEKAFAPSAVEKKTKKDFEEPKDEKALIPTIKKKEDLSSGKKLTAQEIIQKRIAEIGKTKSSPSKEKDKQEPVKPNIKQKKELPKGADKPEIIKNIQSSKDLGIELKTKSDKSEIKENSKSLKNQKTIQKPVVEKPQVEEQDDTDILAEISDLIQIPAPSEYFLKEEGSKDVVKAEIEDSGKHSFSFWLNHLSKAKTGLLEETKGIKEEKKIKSSTNKKENGHLIDSFLSDKKTKLIKPSEKGVPSNNLPEKAIEEEESIGFMTETLAQIYIKQAYYEKAIEAYVKLSLKYPKKNTYFASQIEKIKTLQLNS